MNYKDSYKRLPERTHVPDIVEECQELLIAISYYNAKTRDIEYELKRKHRKMIEYLRKHWTDQEIVAAGFDLFLD